MANTLVLTASGVVKAGSGSLYAVNVTKAGTGASAVTVYDNASTNSGNKLFDGDGLSQQSFQMQGPTRGVNASQGIYVALAGTTAPTVVVVYE